MASPETNTSRKREVFDTVAVDYDAVRPKYPEQLIDDAITISAIPQGGTILEIGCGTGQATVSFAQRGYAMTCLEIGSNLAELAARNLGKFPGVKVINAAFEQWDPVGVTYDLALAATAFHWIDSHIALYKTTECLNDTGCLAIISNLHPRPFAGFFAHVQEIYQCVVPEWGDLGTMVPTDREIENETSRIKNTGFFQKVIVKQYNWSRNYNTQDYLRLLNSYSDHRELDMERRNLLFNRIGKLIDVEYGGKVTKPYLSILTIANKIGNQTNG